MVDNGSSGRRRRADRASRAGCGWSGSTPLRRHPARAANHGLAARAVPISSDWSSTAPVWRRPACSTSARRAAGLARAAGDHRAGVPPRPGASHARLRRRATTKRPRTRSSPESGWEADGYRLFESAPGPAPGAVGCSGRRARAAACSPPATIWDGARRARRALHAPRRRARQPRPVPPGVRTRRRGARRAARRGDVPPVPRRGRDVRGDSAGTRCTRTTRPSAECRTAHRRTTRSSSAGSTRPRSSTSKALRAERAAPPPANLD